MDKTMMSEVNKNVLLVVLAIASVILLTPVYAGDGMICTGGQPHDRCVLGIDKWHCWDEDKCVCTGGVNRRIVKYQHCGSTVGTCGSWDVLDCGHVNPCLDNSPCCVPNCSGKNCGSDGCSGTCGSCPSNGYVGARWCSGTTIQQSFRSYWCSGGGVCQHSDTTLNISTCDDEWLTSPPPWCVANGTMQEVWGKFRTGTCSSGACDITVVNDKYNKTCNPNAVPVTPSVVYCDSRFDKVERVRRCPCQPGSYTCNCQIRDEIIGSCLVPLFTVRYNNQDVVIAGVDASVSISTAILPATRRHMKFIKENTRYFVLYDVTTSASASKVMVRIDATPTDRALIKYNPPRQYIRTCNISSGSYGPSGPVVNCGSSATCAGAPACTYGPTGLAGISCVSNCP